MARQTYFVNTSDKQLEVLSSFGGGMVTQTHPEKLRDDESVLIENADILAGGVIQSRGAYAQTNSNAGAFTGNTQGRFKYQNLAGGQDIVAINGKLYSYVNNTYTVIPITGMTSFQASRPIEAVQLREKMYFATGSGVVIYNGTTASVMVAYAPTGLEALYIGTNGYAVNPDTFLSDTTGAGNAILGVAASTRYGIVQVPVTFTAFVTKIAIDVLEYQFETKLVTDASYKVYQAWGTSKTFVKTFTTKSDYMVRVSMRKQGTTVVLSEYVIPRYRVATTPDTKPEPNVAFANISLCNRIFIHYDRLFLYGDTTNPDFLYLSHLNKFEYFPRTNIVNVTDPLRGALQNVIQYKNLLICFTNGSVQMIQGTSPLDFEKTPIHTTLGVKHAYSVQIMSNVVVFVGSDNCVYILKSFNFAGNDRMNVERIDESVKDKITGHIKAATKILSAIYNDQYYLYIETGGFRYIYRYYYDLGIWVRDVLPFSISTLVNLDNVLNVTSLTEGTVYQLTNASFKDGTATSYSMKVQSKEYDFGATSQKKLKQYQILADITALTTITVKLYADDILLSTTPVTYDPTQITNVQKLKVMTSGRFRYVKTELTIPVNELVQIIGFGFVYKMNTPK
jgi:hypothetical protein